MKAFLTLALVPFCLLLFEQDMSAQIVDPICKCQPDPVSGTKNGTASPDPGYSFGSMTIQATGISSVKGECPYGDFCNTEKTCRWDFCYEIDYAPAEAVGGKYLGVPFVFMMGQATLPGLTNELDCGASNCPVVVIYTEEDNEPVRMGTACVTFECEQCTAATS